MKRSDWVIITCAVLLYAIDLLALVATARHLSFYGADGHFTGILFFGMFLYLVTVEGERMNAPLRGDTLAFSVAAQLVVVSMVTTAGVAVYVLY